MTGKIIKSLAKQLIVTAIVIAISIAIMTVNPTAGIILMMLYSSFMVIKSSNKEIPLTKFTAILPGLMSLAIFFIMLGLIDVHDEEMPLIGLGLGIIPGWLMARGHKVYKKDGIVYAKRTFLYVLIWALSILFTQGSTLLGMREITDFGFLLNGFSTAMMVVLSVMLAKKAYLSSDHHVVTANLISLAVVTSILMFTIIPSHAEAYEPRKLSKKRDFHPAGLMSNARRIEDPEKLKRYQNTFQNRNTARTAEQKARAVQYSGFRDNQATDNTNSELISQTPSPNAQSSESSDFSDKVTELSSDEYLDSMSYDNWIKNNKQNNSTQDQTNNDTDSQSNFDSYSSSSDPEFSDDELIAGAAAALMMLLASLGLNASMAVAQGAASAAGNATQGAASNAYSDGNDNYVRGTKMLDGDEAKEWMILHGYIKDEERPDLFQEGRLDKFKDSMPSEKSPELQAWAGKTDTDGNMDKDCVILVDAERTPAPQEPEQNDIEDDTDNVTDIKTNKSNSDSSTDKTTTSSDNSTSVTINTEDASDDKNITSDSSSSDSDDKTTTKSNGSESKPPEDETPSIDYSHVKENLENFMSDIIKDKTDDGYYVRNPHHFEEIKAQIPPFATPITTILTLEEWLEKGFNNAGWIHGHKIDDWLGWKGGQCGDYAQDGIEWSRDKIKEQYGDDVKFDKIIVKSNVAPDLINHAATRVTLPNGEKYVLDYWEGIQNKEKRVYTEDAWVKRHSEKLDTLWQGTEIDYEQSTVSVSSVNDSLNAATSMSERRLDKLIENYGVTEGKKLFLERIKKQDLKDLPDAKKLVAQWRRKP